MKKTKTYKYFTNTIQPIIFDKFLYERTQLFTLDSEFEDLQKIFKKNNETELLNLIKAIYKNDYKPTHLFEELITSNYYTYPNEIEIKKNLSYNSNKRFWNNKENKSEDLLLNNKELLLLKNISTDKTLRNYFSKLKKSNWIFYIKFNQKKNKNKIRSIMILKNLLYKKYISKYYKQMQIQSREFFLDNVKKKDIKNTEEVFENNTINCLNKNNKEIIEQDIPKTTELKEISSEIIKIEEINTVNTENNSNQEENRKEFSIEDSYFYSQQPMFNSLIEFFFLENYEDKLEKITDVVAQRFLEKKKKNKYYFERTGDFIERASPLLWDLDIEYCEEADILIYLILNALHMEKIKNEILLENNYALKVKSKEKNNKPKYFHEGIYFSCSITTNILQQEENYLIITTINIIDNILAILPAKIELFSKISKKNNKIRHETRICKPYFDLFKDYFLLHREGGFIYYLYKYLGTLDEFPKIIDDYVKYELYLYRVSYNPESREKFMLKDPSFINNSRDNLKNNAELKRHALDYIKYKEPILKIKFLKFTEFRRIRETYKKFEHLILMDQYVYKKLSTVFYYREEIYEAMRIQIPEKVPEQTYINIFEAEKYQRRKKSKEKIKKLIHKKLRKVIVQYYWEYY